MDKKVKEKIIEESEKLLEAPSGCAEVKAAAKAWLVAVDTEREAEETEMYKAELKADIMPIDSLITFAGSSTAVAVFGSKEEANSLLSHAKEIKDKGAVYCDCPACSACAEILKVLE